MSTKQKLDELANSSHVFDPGRINVWLSSPVKADDETGATYKLNCEDYGQGIFRFKQPRPRKKKANKKKAKRSK